MMGDQKNTILAIVLSALVFIVWQYFFGLPLQEKQKQVAQQQQQAQQTQPPGAPAETRPAALGQVPGTATPQTTEVSRDEALAKSPRVRIATPRVTVHRQRPLPRLSCRCEHGNSSLHRPAGRVSGSFRCAIVLRRSSRRVR